MSKRKFNENENSHPGLDHTWLVSCQTRTGLCTCTLISHFSFVINSPPVVIDSARPVIPAGVFARFRASHLAGGEADEAKHSDLLWVEISNRVDLTRHILNVITAWVEYKVVGFFQYKWLLCVKDICCIWDLPQLDSSWLIFVWICLPCSWSGDCRMVQERLATTPFIPTTDWRHQEKLAYWRSALPQCVSFTCIGTWTRQKGGRRGEDVLFGLEAYRTKISDLLACGLGPRNECCCCEHPIA